MHEDHPIDPFAGDPADPSRLLGEESQDAPVLLTEEERREVLEDLDEIRQYRDLLEPQNVRGIVVDCEDCGETHYYGWALLESNLRHLLDSGETRVHEPAYQPDPSHYVTWDYARGYADGVADASD